MGDAGATAFADALKVNKTFIIMEFGCAFAAHSAVHLVACPVHVHPAVTIVVGNDITEAGTWALTEAMVVHHRDVYIKLLGERSSVVAPNIDDM
jgi:hypothetical protein